MKLKLPALCYIHVTQTIELGRDKMLGLLSLQKHFNIFLINNRE